MEQSQLITVKAATKEKGFRQDLRKIVPATTGEIQIYEKLRGLVLSPHYERLGFDRKQIVDVVLESYRKKTNGQPLESTHWVLSGHELVEYDRLEDQDVFRYLCYRYKYNKYPELKIVDDYPPCLQIEPTSVCNFRCVMCFQIDKSFSDGHSEHMGYMPLEMFRDLIDQADGHIEAITLASRGEPLLHRNIVEMLEYCRGKFLGLKVNTNASVLTESIIHGLLSCNVQTVVFSIDAADKELYERIRVGGRFDTLLRNLRQFVEIRATHYPKSQTITRISGVKINSLQTMDRMETMWSEYADIVAFTNYTPWHSSYDNPINDIEAPCTELWRRAFVWQDGTVNPCDYDYKSLLSKWNINDATMSEIWSSEAYHDLRRCHIGKMRSQYEPCKRCISV